MPWVPVEDDYQDAVASASENTGLHPEIINSIIQHESSGNPAAISPTGPQGLMQLSKAASAEGGIDPSQRFNPGANIKAGASYYKQMFDKFGPDLAYAAYHDGPGAVQQYLDGKRQLSPEALRGTAKFGKLHKELDSTQTSGRWVPVDETDWEGSTSQIQPQDTGSFLPNMIRGVGGQLMNRMSGVTELFGSEYNPLAEIANKVGIPVPADIATNYLKEQAAKENQWIEGPQTGGKIGQALADMLITAPAGGFASMPTRALATGAIESATTPGNALDRAISGVTGTLLSGAGEGTAKALSFLVNPFRKSIDPVTRKLIDAADAFDIPLNAAQVTGNKSLGYMNSALDYIPSSSTSQQAFKDYQRGAWTESLFDEGGYPFSEFAKDQANAIANGVDLYHAFNVNRLGAMKDSISSAYKDLSSRNYLIVDSQLKSELANVESKLLQRLPTNQKGIVKSYIKDFKQAPGVISGNVYQETRSMLDRQAKAFKNSDPATHQALSTIRDSLDSAMERYLSPKDKALWKDTNRGYMVMKNIEKAIDPTTQEISPNRLINELSKSTPEIMKYGKGPQSLANLARVGKKFVGDKLPDSGTSQRSYMINLLTGAGIGAGVGSLIPGVGSVAGAATSVLLPPLVSKLMQKDAGYLVNGLADMTKKTNIMGLTRDELLRELLRNMATSQNPNR